VKRSDDISVTQAITRLRSREISGKELPKELLLDIVLTLRLHGHGTTALADLLGYSYRQVQRFTKEVWRINRHEFTVEFWKSHIGKYNLRMEAAIEFLTRIYNDSSYAPPARVIAATSAGRLATLWTDTLRSVGCLPIDGIKVKSKLYKDEQAQKSEIDSAENPIMAKLNSIKPYTSEELRLRMIRIYARADEEAGRLLDEAYAAENKPQAVGDIPASGPPNAPNPDGGEAPKI